MFISSPPFAIANTAITTTAIVVVFRPPAVEPGLPPISIRISESNVPESERFERSIVLKPAVLVVTDINIAFTIFCGTVLSASSPLYSKIKKPSPPATSKIAVVTRTILV